MNEVNVADVQEVKPVVGLDLSAVQRFLTSGLNLARMLAEKRNWTQVVTLLDLIISFVGDPELLKLVLDLVEAIKNLSKDKAVTLVKTFVALTK